MPKKHAPVINLGLPDSYPLVAGTSFIVNFTVQDQDKNISGGTLSYGDGTTDLTWNGPVVPSPIIHTYLTAGTYTMRATVVDMTHPKPFTTQSYIQLEVAGGTVTVPSVTITSPPTGTTVSGTVPVVVEGSGVGTPVVTVDGTITQPPIDTTVLIDGSHTIVATAPDNTGTPVVSPPIVVITNNGTTPAAGLITASNLTYEGAFRLPFLDYTIYGTDYSAGAYAFGIDTVRQTLIVKTNDGNNQTYAEYFGAVGIVSPGFSGTVSGLPVGANTTPPTRLFQFKLDTDLGGSFSGRRPRGVLVDGSQMILTAFVSYDGGYLGAKSHFVRDSDLSSAACSSPLEVNAFGSGSASNGGMAGGWQTSIPASWQGAFGADTLACNWDISINGRASWGPCAIAYTRANLGIQVPLQAQALLYYGDAHSTMGRPIQDHAQWNDTGLASGIVFVEGTSTILFYTTHTDFPCYGVGTLNQSLQGQPTGTGDIYCYDIEVGGKGQHGYPYTQRVWAYDANDLVAVKNGIKQPWEPVPYAFWDFVFPQFQNTHFIVGVAYDPGNQLIYCASQYGDAIGANYNAPLIHVFSVAP